MTRRQIQLVNTILQSAKLEIKQRVNVDLNLYYKRKEGNNIDHLREVLEDACECWGVDLLFVSETSREKDRPTMRKLLWMIGKHKFPYITYKTLAELTGVDDHAGVIKGIKKARDLISVGDNKIMKYYECVKHFFD